MMNLIGLRTVTPSYETLEKSSFSGQTDDSDTYGIKDSDGDLLIAPYQAGSILQKESTEIYLRDVLIAAFDEIPDSYVQTIGIRM